MLFFPQFKESSLEVARETEAAGATDAKAVATHVAGRLKSKDLELAVGDPDDPENWLRIWLIWRGNAIMASAKGQEFFLRHYSAPTTTASPRRTRRPRWTPQNRPYMDRPKPAIGAGAQGRMCCNAFPPGEQAA